MSQEGLSLDGVKTLSQVLDRTPNGAALVDLATRLGLWTASAHRGVQERPGFSSNLADLTADQISNEMGRWTAEFGRITELLGALNGQRDYLRTKLKAVTAQARSTARRNQKEGEKPLTASAVGDLAEEDPSVLDVSERLALVELLIAQVGATKEATAQYLSSISREIAFRDAQLKARIYG